MAAEHAEQRLSAILATDATEPLRGLAAEAYEISDRLCGTCRDLHALWPYIRLSRASTGVEGRESRLHAANYARFLAVGFAVCSSPARKTPASLR
jgi:hypothetical protein